MSAKKAAQHHREVLQSITNLQVCGVSPPFKTASPAGAQNTTAGQCNLFAMLPHEVVHTVLAQLSNDTRSLQNLTLTCRAFASLFR